MSSTLVPFTGPVARDRIEQLEKRNRDQNKEIKDLKEQLELESSKSQQYIGETQDLVLAQKGKIEILEQQVLEEKSALESYKQQLSGEKDEALEELNQKLQELEQKQEDKDKEIERLRKENQQLKERLVLQQDKDKEIERLREENCQLKAIIDKHKETEEELRRDLMNAERKATRTTRDVAALKEISQQIVRPMNRQRDDSGVSVSSLNIADDGEGLSTIAEDK